MPIKFDTEPEISETFIPVPNLKFDLAGQLLTALKAKKVIGEKMQTATGGTLDVLDAKKVNLEKAVNASIEYYRKETSYYQLKNKKLQEKVAELEAKLKDSVPKVKTNPVADGRRKFKDE